MKVISTNLAKPTTFLWNGKEEQTGIFKYPISQPLTLEMEAVANDTISNRKVHGGVHKACYLFAANQYPIWKEKFPHLDWNWGMFGENLTVEGLNEAEIRIGNVYRIGSTLVQVSQPREPCYKLGIRFGDQSILKQFIAHAYPGTYVRVLEEGSVQTGDYLQMVEQSQNSLTVKQFFQLLYAKEKDIGLIKTAIDNPSLPAYKRERLKKYL